MPLTIHTTHDERIVGACVEQCVRTGVGRGGCVLLVPSFGEAFCAQKDLVRLGGLSLGVEVSTPEAWARDCWDVWGDGTCLVNPQQRALLIHRVLGGATSLGSLAATPGTIGLLCSLVQQAMPWVEAALGEESGQGRGHVAVVAGLVGGGPAFTKAERRAMRIIGDYAHLLAELGLKECSSVMVGLPTALKAAGAKVPTVVVSGFCELTCSQRALLVGLSALTEVHVVVRDGGTAASDATRTTVEELAREAAEVTGVTPALLPEGGRDVPLPRAAELAALNTSLFGAGEVRVRGEGAVRLLEPGGPLAEAELVCREVVDLVGAGAHSVVVAVPDTVRAWRELAPKLVSRGLSVEAQLSLPVLSTRAGSAFMGFARSVARLAELAAAPHKTRAYAGFFYEDPGDMSWWPPVELIDFLLSDISHVPVERAHALAAAWRSNRLLSADDVLDQLQSAKYTSQPVERAVREVLRGRLGSAATRLLEPFDPLGKGGDADLVQAEATGALAAVLGAAGSLKELGMTADGAAGAAVSLGGLVDRLELALDQARVTLRPRAGVAGAAADGLHGSSARTVPPRQDEGATVRIMGRRQAASLAAGSADVLVICGLTSDDMPIAAGDDLLTSLLAALGAEQVHDPVMGERARFARLVSVAKHSLVLERPLFSADAKPTYPAVMLTELLSSYDEDLPRVGFAEVPASANVAAKGAVPAPQASEYLAGAGRIDPSLSALVEVPQEGRPELTDGLPLLSASQLESYLECPLKWFSLRRLKLKDNDAGFGGLEMGTFAHRVMELTYSRLLDEARTRADGGQSGEGRQGMPVEEACPGEKTGQAPLHDDAAQGAEPSVADLIRRLPGCAVVQGDADGLMHARNVLDEVFAEHLSHQYLKEGNHAAYQALVAHSSAEEAQVERLRRDLLSELDFEAPLLIGFEPRLFEWEFGRGKQEVRYAGVRVTGTVDRVDVDAHGKAVVVDYKHKDAGSFFAEYAVFGPDGHAAGTPLTLPRRIQALMYAQIVRRAYPELEVVGALYLGTKGDHALSGAVSANFEERVFGSGLSSRRAPRVLVADGDVFAFGDASLQNGGGAVDAAAGDARQAGARGHEASAVGAQRGFYALLDACEELIAQKIELLRAGNIEAAPVDDAACAFCPVLNCERRL